MYYWKLLHVNSPLNVWGIALSKHTLFTEPMERTLWSIKLSRPAVVEKCTSDRSLSIFSIVVCEQQGEEKRWNKADTYTASTQWWLRDVIYHSLDTYQSWRCLIENPISRLVWLKKYLRFPVIYRLLKLSSKSEELQLALMHKCTTFSASSQFHRFQWSGSTRYYNTLAKRTQ